MDHQGLVKRLRVPAGWTAWHDVDVSWWVRPEAYERGPHVAVYRALRHWIATEFPFPSPHYSNAELPDLGTLSG